VKWFMHSFSMVKLLDSKNGSCQLKNCVFPWTSVPISQPTHPIQILPIWIFLIILSLYLSFALKFWVDCRPLGTIFSFGITINFTYHNLVILRILLWIIYFRILFTIISANILTFMITATMPRGVGCPPKQGGGHM